MRVCVLACAAVTYTENENTGGTKTVLLVRQHKSDQREALPRRQNELLEQYFTSAEPCNHMYYIPNSYRSRHAGKKKEKLAVSVGTL